MANQTLSITKLGQNEPFDLQVARGQITNHQALFRSAYSSFAVNSATRAIWNRASAYVFPASASIMTLSSSVVGDVGQVVLVQGLDASYNQISEVIILNGQTAVNSTKSYLRINDMLVVAGVPTGNICFGTGVVTAGVPANVYSFISAGDNKTQMAVYTVPAGYTLFVTGGSVSTSGLSTSSFMTIDFRGIIGGIDYSSAKIFAANTFQFFPYSPPSAVPEKSDIYDTVLNSVAGPDKLMTSLTGILIKNDGTL